MFKLRSLFFLMRTTPSSLQRASYFFAGVDRTFFSSISLFAALFFSALSCVFGGEEFCGFRGLVTGSVAVLSPAAAASTSTVATLQSPPPTIVDSVSSRDFLTIVKRCTLNDSVLNRSSFPCERVQVPLRVVVGAFRSFGARAAILVHTLIVIRPITQCQ